MTTYKFGQMQLPHYNAMVQLIVYPLWHSSGVLRYLILLVVLSMDKYLIGELYHIMMP